MKAATPPFATKEPAAHEVAEEAAVVREVEEEAVDARLVGNLPWMAMEAVDPPVTPVPPATLVPLAALDPEDAVTEPDTDGQDRESHLVQPE